MNALVRYFDPAFGVRIGLRDGNRVYDVTGRFSTIGAWLRESSQRVEAAIADLHTEAQRSNRQLEYSTLLHPPTADRYYLLPPVDEQDVWAAGVTYARSREARQEEALDGGDVYARVYAAERPELFFKAQGKWAVGHLGEVGIRGDSAWNVPEPELTLVVNPALEIVGFTIGNDMSSRDIEGANPLYLPQAKIYTASCALGPQIVLHPLTDYPPLTITLVIERAGIPVVQASISTDQLHRRAQDLVAWLGRHMQFPDGVLLMTGTGIVPASDFTLAVGDAIQIGMGEAGTLVNTVTVISS
ncbi:MAG: fumarylacetoacetate hydrolase family protein [Anaerolineae bacterium]